MKNFAVVLFIILLIGGGGSWWFRSEIEQVLTKVGLISSTKKVEGVTAKPPRGENSSPSGGAGSGRRRFGGGRPQPISAEVVRKQDIRSVINAIGNIAALNSVVVRSRVDGMLQKISFKEGHKVKAKKILAEIDPRPFQVTLNAAEATLAKINLCYL